MKLATLVLLVVFPIFGKDKVDPRLREISNIFLGGAGEAADKIREVVTKGKTCFAIVEKPDEADGILELVEEVSTGGDNLVSHSARQIALTGKVSLKGSADAIWVQTQRATDTSFLSGSKAAGELLIKFLAKDAACKERGEAKRAK